jgi:hypothetical protein
MGDLEVVREHGGQHWPQPPGVLSHSQPTITLHIQDPALKHLAADVAQFIDAPRLAWQAALSPQHHLGAWAGRSNHL